MAPKKISKHLETPQKNKIRGAAEFCEKQGIKVTQNQLASTFAVSRRQVQYALQSGHSRTAESSELKARNHEKLTKRDLDRVELFIKDNGPEGHELDWSELVY